MPLACLFQGASGLAISCEVLLDDIEVMAHIGAFAAEQGVPQPLEICVALSVTPPSEDEMSQTFDYSIIRAWAIELATQRICLIETFALRLAKMCLASDLVLEAAIEVRKPWAVPSSTAGTRVKIRRDGTPRQAFSRHRHDNLRTRR